MCSVYSLLLHPVVLTSKTPTLVSQWSLGTFQSLWWKEWRSTPNQTVPLRKHILCTLKNNKRGQYIFCFRFQMTSHDKIYKHIIKIHIYLPPAPICLEANNKYHKTHDGTVKKIHFSSFAFRWKTPITKRGHYFFNAWPFLLNDLQIIKYVYWIYCHLHNNIVSLWQ